MGQDTEELKREIERTRDDLGGTLDAIGDRVSPGRIVERKKNRLKNSVQSARDRVMGPMHAGTHGVSATAHDAAQSMHDATGTAVDAVKHTPEMARERTEGSPMVAGALAFGVGFLVAAAFPPSRSEREMGPAVLDKIEPVKQELAATGSALAHDLEEPARQAASDLADRVRSGCRRRRRHGQARHRRLTGPPTGDRRAPRRSPVRGFPTSGGATMICSRPRRARVDWRRDRCALGGGRLVFVPVTAVTPRTPGHAHGLRSRDDPPVAAVERRDHPHRARDPRHRRDGAVRRTGGLRRARSRSPRCQRRSRARVVEPAQRVVVAAWRRRARR